MADMNIMELFSPTKKRNLSGSFTGQYTPIGGDRQMVLYENKEEKGDVEMTDRPLGPYGSFTKKPMSVAVPGTVTLNTGGAKAPRRRYGGGYYKKKYLSAKKSLSRYRNRAKRQKEQFKAAHPQDYDSWVRATFGESWKLANEQQKAAREAHNFYGKGDYKTWLAYASRGLGGLAGGAMGYMSGGLQGAISGAQSGFGQGASFSKFMGWGDYGTSMNQIMGGSNKGQMSVNSLDYSGDVYLTQTEFVQNVSCSASGAGASPFQIVSFPLNPGLSVTFPFLSQIAQNYTLYEFEGLIFKFNPTSGENNATSNALGKVILATQYDPDATPFINSVQMENYDYANAAKPSVSIFHGVETDNSQQVINQQYVRTGISSKSKIFTDIGTFYVATEGVPFAAAGTQVLGELWVTYRIKLSRANLYGALLGQNISQDVIGGTTSAAQLSTGTTFVKSTNQIGLTVVPIGATSFSVVFPTNISLGSYMILVEFRSGATVFTTQAVSAPSIPANCQIYVPGSSLPGTNVAQVAPQGSVGTTTNLQLLGCHWVTVQAPGNSQASFTVNVSAALTATTQWRIWATQVNQIPSLSLA